MNANDHKKMKELASRLVAMSPEPPPFPEEVIMTVPTKTTKRNPVLIFAGAAAVVLAAAAVPLFLNGGGTNPPPVGTTQPTVVSTVPTETTIPDDTTPSTGIPTVSHDVEVFFVQTPENSFLSNPALVSFYTQVSGAEGASPELLALQLLTNPDLVLPTPGYWNAVAAGVQVLGVSNTEMDGSPTIVVDMNQKFLEGAGGLLSDMTMLNQLIYTATQSGFDQVQFTVGGSPVEAYGTEGLVLTDPVTRESFLDSLNSVLVTEPFIFGGDELPTISGIANVFEATVSLEIVGSESGEVVYQDFTTATCGTGCWGEFAFSLDTPVLETGQFVRVFWNSPQDGARSDVVYVPVSPGPYWNFLPEQQ